MNIGKTGVGLARPGMLVTCIKNCEQDSQRSHNRVMRGGRREGQTMQAMAGYIDKQMMMMIDNEWQDNLQNFDNQRKQ